MIRIENLTKRFGRTIAVDGVSLEVPAGDALSLWGSNGAGKSTILRCVLGLLRYRGRIEVGGFDARRQGRCARRLIGYVPQELGFNDDLRVGEAVCFFARLKGARVESISGTLAGVGLTGQDRKRMRELSGGMKQRLALALALLGDPPILILDEVTASLDACGREEFVSLLARLRRDGKSLLFASHRLDEVTALAERVLLLERGVSIGEVPACQLAARLGPGTTLHLHLQAGLRQRAMELLQTHGFAPRLNGVGILVPVPTPQKAAPFRILNDARIGIENFEIVSGEHKEAMR
jgi:ABC-type multidrug transport system ATPase subunit